MTARERRAAIRARQKEHRRKMIRLYSWRGIIISLLLLAITLILYGVLYIKEHLTYVPESEPSVGYMETYAKVNGISSPDLPNPPIIPMEAAIHEGTLLPDGIVEDILPFNEYCCFAPQTNT